LDSGARHRLSGPAVRRRVHGISGIHRLTCRHLDERPDAGLHAHGNFQIDGPDWGINKPDTLIEPPHLTLEKATRIALDAAEKNVALSWNMLMYDDGTVSDASLSLLQQVGKEVRRQYPRSKV
jgi:hypothetical protein